MTNVSAGLKRALCGAIALLLAACASSGIQEIGVKQNLDGTVTDYRAITIKADKGPVQIRSESRDYKVDGQNYTQIGDTKIAVTGGNDLGHDLGVAAVQIPAAIAGGVALGLAMPGTTVHGSTATGGCATSTSGTGSNGGGC